MILASYDSIYMLFIVVYCIIIVSVRNKSSQMSVQDQEELNRLKGIFTMMNFCAISWKQKLAVLVAGGWATFAFSQEQQQPNIGELLQSIMQNAGKQQAGAPSLISPKDLKAALPEELPDMKRVSRSSEKSGAFGINVASAEATYRAESGATISIKVTDTGGLGGLGAMAQAGFAMSEIDRETETGYERSTTYKGYRAMEEYDSRYEKGSIVLMAEHRLNIEINGKTTDMEQVKGALDVLDLDAIIGLIEKAESEISEQPAD